MSALPPKQSQRLTLLEKYISEASSQLYTLFPEIKLYLDSRKLTLESFKRRPQTEAFKATAVPNTVSSSSVSTAVTDSFKTDDPLPVQVTAEEYNAIIEKLRQALLEPPGSIEPTSLLYLEQQLSDIFGFTIVGTLDGWQLPFHTGMIEAEPHRRRFPGDELRLHERYQEAGMTPIRSSFGWFTQHNTLTKESEDREQFGVSLPLQQLPQWSSSYQQIKSWFMYKKVLVINPFDYKAIVATVFDCKTQHTLRFQFGGSPELIREGMFWSPQAQGRACILFVDDRDDKVPLGTVMFPNNIVNGV